MTNNLLWVVTILFSLIFFVLSTPDHHGRTLFSPKETRTLSTRHERHRVLLLTAHPDDECMFFAPTLLTLSKDVSEKSTSPDMLERDGRELGLETSADVYSLCLSSGDADGLGETRKRELNGSLDVLGVPPSRRRVLDEPLVSYLIIVLFY